MDPDAFAVADENRRGAWSAAQSAELRKLAADELQIALVLLALWGVSIGFADLVGGHRVAVFAAFIEAILFVTLATMALRRWVRCRADAATSPVVLEGELDIKRHVDRRGHRSVDVTVGGAPVWASLERAERIPATTGRTRAYVGGRSRTLIAIEAAPVPPRTPRHPRR